MGSNPGEAIPGELKRHWKQHNSDVHRFFSIGYIDGLLWKPVNIHFHLPYVTLIMLS